jgi:hypothetical protein
MIAEIVVPAGMRSIARMRACFVSGRFAAEGASRVRDLDLLVFPEAERAAALGFDLSLVMESSEVRAALSAAPPQPRRVNHPAGRDPMGAFRARPSRHSNAPIKDKSQSFLSNIITGRVKIMGSNPSLSANDAFAIVRRRSS